MSQPVDDAALVRAKIVDAALAEIEAVGLTRTTMKNVAGRADISISLISYYFGSKNQLIQACSKQWLKTFSGMAQRLLSILASAADTDELLRLVVRETLKTGRSHQLEIRLMLREAALKTDGGVPVVGEGMDKLDLVDKAIATRLQISVERVRAVFHQAAMLLIRACVLSDEELTRIYSAEPAPAWKICSAHLEETFVVAFATDFSMNQ